MRLQVREGEWTPVPRVAVEQGLEFARSVAAADARLRKRLPVGFGAAIEFDALTQRIRVRHVGGWLRLGPLDLAVVPACVSEEHWLDTFVSWYVLASARNPTSVAYLSGRLALGSDQRALLELLALHFARVLRHALDEQPLAAYSRTRLRSEESRGRLLAERNARLLPHQLGALWYDRSTLAAPPAALRLLGWAVGWLRQRVTLRVVRQQLEGLAHDLPDVEEPPATTAPWRLTAGTAAYDEPLAIARELALTGRGARRPSPETRAAGRPAASLLLNTYTAFEALVTAGWAELARSRGWRHNAQDTRTVASVVSGAGAVDRETRIDDAVSTGSGAGLLLSDSKYKTRADRGVSREDLYQLISTCLAHGVDRGLLVLPHGPAETVLLKVPSDLLVRPVHVVATNTPVAGRTPGELLAAVTRTLQAAADGLLSRSAPVLV